MRSELDDGLSRPDAGGGSSRGGGGTFTADVTDCNHSGPSPRIASNGSSCGELGAWRWGAVLMLGPLKSLPRGGRVDPGLCALRPGEIWRLPPVFTDVFRVPSSRKNVRAPLMDLGVRQLPGVGGGAFRLGEGGADACRVAAASNSTAVLPPAVVLAGACEPPCPGLATPCCIMATRSGSKPRAVLAKGSSPA